MVDVSLMIRQDETMYLEINTICHQQHGMVVYDTDSGN
jgi:hypothetical protein